MNEEEKMKYIYAISRLNTALTIAKMAIQQGVPFEACIAANGPTIATVIAEAQKAAEKVLEKA